MSTKKNTVPRHVVIIPDGNRRWAKDRGEKPWVGHRAATENFQDIIRSAREQGVEYLTLWGSSLENLEKRPLQEKLALLEIYEQYFSKMMSDDEVAENGVRIRVIGRWRETFPQKLIKIFEKGIADTKNNGKFNLTICLAYSGDDEMQRAIKKVVVDGLEPEDITREAIKERLMTHDLPPVDYLIRTGGEPHLSVGFMMWDIANAQLFFTEQMCPDFKAEEFNDSLEEYANRARRHGS